MRADQLALHLETIPDYTWQTFFVSSSNQLAVSWVKRWPDWSFPILILYGPRGCGKTHLAHLWQQKTRAQFISDSFLKDFQKGCVSIPPESTWIWDGLPGEGDERDQENLLHVYNQVRENQGSLVLLSDSPPARWGMTLPDLTSRLGSTPAVSMEEPDDELLRAVLRKQFADAQVTVSDASLTYLLRHMERSFASAQDLCHQINAYALKNQRGITVPLVREVIQNVP